MGFEDGPVVEPLVTDVTHLANDASEKEVGDETWQPNLPHGKVARGGNPAALITSASEVGNKRYPTCKL